MEPSSFQSAVQKLIGNGRSVLLIAPTGLGKTFAVTGNLQQQYQKTIYAVPLRALGCGIRDAIREFKRDNTSLAPVIHHGDTQESELFSEEVVITTYDQVVCGVPGLPLSLPLSAGHAVSGALLMSCLILDEVHLAWGISDQALTILLAIIDFRRKLNLQTVVITATLPDAVAKVISERLGLELVIVGEDDLADDEGLKLRKGNRQLAVSVLELKPRDKGENKQLDFSPLDEKLVGAQGKRIYFANTVDRLQQTYDRLIDEGLQPSKITALHNRMPRSWRSKAEEQVHDRFGKNSPEGDWVLLTNQVAEAGLDISAPLVISDPAPVDTLVQRSGRCARWFRKGKTNGDFFVVKVPSAQLKEWAPPYREAVVGAGLKTIPEGQLSWTAERDWINKVWGIGLKQGKLPEPEDVPKKQKEQIEHSLNKTAFALNLFDRAAQKRKPGEIANEFREILSVEVAVEEGEQVRLDDLAQRDLQVMLSLGQYPETSSVSLGRAWSLIRKAKNGAVIISFENDELILRPASYVRPGDVLIVPSSAAYLHPNKGLCFDDGSNVPGAVLTSDWLDRRKKRVQQYALGRRQGLLEHTTNVMDAAYRRFAESGAYRNPLVKILEALEPQKDANQLADLIAELARVAAAFHDLGKADQRWQARARDLDPQHFAQLIGRTLNTGEHIGIPHTPPSYAATIRACELLIGSLGSAEYLIRAIALAAARHHSSFLNPSGVKNYAFHPHLETVAFLKNVLAQMNAPKTVLDHVDEVIIAAKTRPTADQVPLMLPNDDLFPVYALVGRAILLADREDAKGEEIEQWRYAP
ncbi:MAG: CRISPR-associated endonuclease/helicase Cas3 [Dehalococcoidia bacterium]|nr:CRISPR-associated endonuclease/helicase Cas3 [Bacillota bacterium]